jgi:DNA-binding transcriptional LysR family regulator
MGVNQTTVARRIEALEAALSIRLFHRNRDGYRLTEEGTAILAQAERVRPKSKPSSTWPPSAIATALTSCA